VLLVEANLRTPALARLLGFEPAVCLSEQLELHRTRLTAPWDVTEAAPCLHVVAAAPEPRTRPMLDGRALAICLEQLRHAGYDHVVVDSPSILESADVNVIEESVDGIVLTLRARRSRGHGSRKAIEQIGSGKLLGVVLIDA
jgi:Mrp family chromosome partitioning ATPase